MINDVYVQIPVLENDRFILRKIYKEKDTKELLKVYSDDKSVPFLIQITVMVMIFLIKQWKKWKMQSNFGIFHINISIL
ncbi:hypothetical protein AALB81_05610 [Lachnospiraceae bacterium 48-33]